MVDADLRRVFTDSIPHAELLRSLARRISDGRLLALLARWLEMPVEETDDEEQAANDAQPGRRQGHAAKRRLYRRC